MFDEEAITQKIHRREDEFIITDGHDCLLYFIMLCIIYGTDDVVIMYNHFM